MQVMSDGGMRLIIGGESYEVHKGLRSFFSQELVDVSTGAGQEEPSAVTFLGQVTKKLVITPRLGVDP